MGFFLTERIVFYLDVVFFDGFAEGEQGLVGEGHLTANLTCPCGNEEDLR